MIPPILHRTIPEKPSDEMEELWDKACALHPGWKHSTYQDPIEPDLFPLTSEHWATCTSGAQLAGLIRLEALVAFGGVYIDSDVEIVRPLDSLLSCQAFACWEDNIIVPDAVLGCEPGHPAFVEMLGLAINRLQGFAPRPFDNWMDDRGAWSTGPGVTTITLPYRNDVICLPRDAFYPVHYEPRDTLQERLDSFRAPPWVFGIHRWRASWC